MFQIYFGASAVSTAYTLTAASGNFALTGNVAGLLYSRRLAAVTASYALTGNAVAFKRGYLMPAAQASYLLTGNPAALTISSIGVYLLPGTRDVRRARARQPIEAEG